MNLRMQGYAETIEALHEKWDPHEGQIKVGRPLLYEGCKDIMVQAGRNWGKTELMCYLLWRWAKQNPGTENYYFSPYFKQSKEIVWSSSRMQNFGPKSWIDSINNSELRIRFKNKSFIKLDGSDNVEAYRGVKPRGLIVFDEFKDFRPEFFEAFDPNRAAHQAPLVIIGTPPDRECQFTKIAEDYQRSDKKTFIHAPSSQNPHLSKSWLAEKKADLYAKGEGDVWEREYEARLVKGGASKIFPMLDRRIVKYHKDIMNEIKRDIKKLEWLVWADPAAATCFAVLMIAINPFSKKIYVLDELYETDQGKMSVRQMAVRINKHSMDLQDRKEWRRGYDEAETWWASEMQDIYGEYWEPSHKHLNDKKEGLSLIKDIMLLDRLVISDKCDKFFWEMDNYYKDRNGNIPKANDHLIDCFRYILGAYCYDIETEIEKTEKDNEDFRGAKIIDDFPNIYDPMGSEGYDEGF